MMKQITTIPSGMKENGVNTFCPGCLHSSAAKLVYQALDELGITDEAMMVIGVGCNANLRGYINIDHYGAPHGRACAVAGAFKRCRPDTFVMTHQGDGDLAAIGFAETLHSANRGDNISVIFVNNGIYGMTGGQLAPTTLLGARTTTTPFGRDAKEHGYPMHMCELLDTLPAPSYIARVTCTDPANIRKAQKCVRDAFQHQLDGKGFSFVEFVSNCPTNWGMTPLQSLEHIKNVVLNEYPLGVFRDK